MVVAYAFKQHGLFKVLTENGFIMGAWDFKSEKYAAKYIPGWMLSQNISVEWVREYWRDDRVQAAIRQYEANFPGASFDGFAKE